MHMGEGEWSHLALLDYHPLERALQNKFEVLCARPSSCNWHDHGTHFCCVQGHRMERVSMQEKALKHCLCSFRLFSILYY